MNIRKTCYAAAAALTVALTAATAAPASAAAPPIAEDDPPPLLPPDAVPVQPPYRAYDDIFPPANPNSPSYPPGPYVGSSVAPEVGPDLILSCTLPGYLNGGAPIIAEHVITFYGETATIEPTGRLGASVPPDFKPAGHKVSKTPTRITLQFPNGGYIAIDRRDGSESVMLDGQQQVFGSCDRAPAPKF